MLFLHGVTSHTDPDLGLDDGSVSRIAARCFCDLVMMCKIR